MIQLWNNNNTFQSDNSGNTSSPSISKDELIRGLNENLARECFVA